MVVDPQAAGLVVFAVLCNDLALESVHEFTVMIAVAAIARDPIVPVDVEIHGDTS